MHCQWQRKKRHKPEILGDRYPHSQEEKQNVKVVGDFPLLAVKRPICLPALMIAIQNVTDSLKRHVWAPGTCSPSCEDKRLGQSEPKQITSDLQRSGSGKGYSHQPSQEKIQGSNRDKHSLRVTMAMPIM